MRKPHDPWTPTAAEAALFPQGAKYRNHAGPIASRVRVVAGALARRHQEAVAAYRAELADLGTMPLARVRRAVERAHAPAEAGAKTVDAAAAELAAQRADVEARRALTLTGAALESEVRQHVARLPAQARGELLAQARAADDRGTLAAILAAPHYLSGMSREEWDLERHQTLERLFPAESEELRQLVWAEEQVARAGRLFADEVGRLLPYDLAAAQPDDLNAHEQATALANADLERRRLERRGQGPLPPKPGPADRRDPRGQLLRDMAARAADPGAPEAP